MKVRPIAFDSPGTRSTATLVEARDLSILVDPGAALGPWRYWLPPTTWRRRGQRNMCSIKETAKRADLLVITHYHRDHYLPKESIWSRGCF